MLFQTQFYVLVFLPVSLALYYLAAANAAWRQWILLGCSLFFYAWWDIRFVPLLIGQITATWLLAKLHERTGQRFILIAGVVLNLLSLATFKYLDFLIGIVETATGLALPRAHLVLPIGISFFSFQLISYLIDRLRNDAPIYPYQPFALFVLLFPHLIAGPIVRHNELIPQFDRDPRNSGNWANVGAGLVIFTIGFAKKVLLADQLAGVVDPLFARASSHALTFGEAWSATLGFSLQLFLDFSAYTEMAIGTALLFGLVLPENFRRPYLARDLRDFWQRWHISLSRFIRDYLYIPLGGSRNGPVRYVIAALGSMAVCGLWHGAGWTFVIWGIWHGLGLIVCRAWQGLERPLPAAAGWLLTMAFVICGWVVFRAESLSTAKAVFSSLAGFNGVSGTFLSAKTMILAAIASVAIPSAHEIRDQLLKPYPVWAFAGGVLAVVCILEVGKGAPVSFIYFQF